MSKNKKTGFANLRIFILVGVIGAAIGSAVTAFLYFKYGKSKKKEDLDPGKNETE